MTEKSYHPQRSGHADAVERAGVLIALAADTEWPSGACPSLEDIAAWHDQMLPAAEVSHVRSHIARCPKCYAKWSSLADAALAVSPRREIARRTTILELWAKVRAASKSRVGMAAAMSALVVALFAVIPLRQATLESQIDASYVQLAGLNIGDDWAWRSAVVSPEFKIRGEADADYYAFRAGVRQGLEQVVRKSDYWQEVVAALPPHPLPCQQDDQGCQDRSVQMRNAGRWAVLVHLACIGPEVKSEFWTTQVQIAKRILKTFATPDNASTMERAIVRAVAEVQDDHPRKRLCGASFRLLGSALGGE